MNSLLVCLSRDQGITIPMIDGGSEGLAGQARVIMPQETPCYECTMWMITPPVTYNVCTIASNPRVPAHCVEWAMMEFPKVHGLKNLSC